MSLRHGRPYLAIPGPSVLPDQVLQAMQCPAPDIYGPGMPRLVQGIVDDLRAVARTTQNVALYIANGHGAWEAALANTCCRGDKVLVLATGAFGHGWAGRAQAMGLEARVMDFGKRAGAEADRVAERLRADRTHEIRAVLAVQTDTASSARTDIAALRAALDAAGHPALLMVDSIAALACERMEMDAWGVDVLLAASQKGLMTPPGLAFVFFSERAARCGGDLVSPYWDWTLRANPEEFWHYFGGTAPTHHLFALRAALDLLMEEGLTHALDRHARLARAVWAAVGVWGEGGEMRPNIPDPAARSHAVTTLHLGAPNGTALRDWLEINTGVTLGIGLGMAAPGDPAFHGYFRLAHMGHVNAYMVLGALGAIETGLRALGISHGAGALDAAAQVMAGV
ncbi:alanine-glyoxylate transaminase/serine-glyoxylate transaminase/serine-pyruvate transaminase [Rhodovulum imhoffii]|uniref:Alanine-glyoxylate transaminase/serine-glyoxylate transaminase/serine-pyruvate transaminase n=1 Tax=Rhodovulum imhoffii TaxID=365340 RepID=A0A2T5BR23_9RHOB|nr:aminotransferase class V-fold PLP-dependent enzyme [Rhodovulum imhoffii]MBK5934966.1 aminotransferase [Rhodovulum imhoffii]PTN01683.1 alanine-glyoxylate transaminase/serine-glyoxylate transaminase/serine-pyruvate transaminase [Rhodovulum imhoffii]